MASGGPMWENVQASSYATGIVRRILARSDVEVTSGLVQSLEREIAAELVELEDDHRNRFEREVTRLAEMAIPEPKEVVQTETILKIPVCAACAEPIRAGRPSCVCAVETEFIEYQARSLPGAFGQLSTASTLPYGVSRRYLKGLMTDLDRTRVTTVLVAEVGHPHNAVVLLRYIAEQAGHNFDAGRLEKQPTLLRWHEEATAGAGLMRELGPGPGRDD